MIIFNDFFLSIFHTLDLILSIFMATIYSTRHSPTFNVFNFIYYFEMYSYILKEISNIIYFLGYSLNFFSFFCSIRYFVKHFKIYFFISQIKIKFN